MRPRMMIDGREHMLLGYLEDLPKKGGRHYEIDGQHFAAFLIGDKVYVIDNTCPHEGGSLSDGTVDRGRIICPMHAWAIEVSTGHNLTDPGNDINTYPAVVQDGLVWIELSRHG